jgi:hypothetical protein
MAYNRLQLYIFLIVSTGSYYSVGANNEIPSKDMSNNEEMKQCIIREAMLLLGSSLYSVSNFYQEKDPSRSIASGGKQEPKQDICKTKKWLDENKDKVEELVRTVQRNVCVEGTMVRVSGLSYGVCVDVIKMVLEYSYDLFPSSVIVAGGSAEIQFGSEEEAKHLVDVGFRYRMLEYPTFFSSSYDRYIFLIAELTEEYLSFPSTVQAALLPDNSMNIFASMYAERFNEHLVVVIGMLKESNASTREKDRVILDIITKPLIIDGNKFEVFSLGVF